MGSFYIKIAALKHLPKSVAIYNYRTNVRCQFFTFYCKSWHCTSCQSPTVISSRTYCPDDPLRSQIQASEIGLLTREPSHDRDYILTSSTSP